MSTVERLLRTWCRVNVRRNKSLMELAEETSNMRLLQLLNHYSATSELVAAAFSCDSELVRSILRRSRMLGRIHSGSDSLLLGSKQFVTCTRSNTVTSGTGSVPVISQPVRPDIVPGNKIAANTHLIIIIIIIIIRPILLHVLLRLLLLALSGLDM